MLCINFMLCLNGPASLPDNKRYNLVHFLIFFYFTYFYIFFQIVLSIACYFDDITLVLYFLCY